MPPLLLDCLQLFARDERQALVDEMTDIVDDMIEYKWYRVEQNESGAQSLSGTLDMWGNVWEWLATLAAPKRPNENQGRRI